MNTNKIIPGKIESELDNLKLNHENWYRSLPQGGVDFAVAIQVGNKYKISRATVWRLLINDKLFKKVGKRYIQIIK